MSDSDLNLKILQESLYLLQITSTISTSAYHKEGTTEWKVLQHCHMKALVICDAKVNCPVFQSPFKCTALFLCKYTKKYTNKYERLYADRQTDRQTDRYLPAAVAALQTDNKRLSIIIFRPHGAKPASVLLSLFFFGAVGTSHLY